MGHRRKGRELALQALYEMEMREAEPKSVLNLLNQRGELPAEMSDFVSQLVEGTYRNRREIDEIIEKHAAHWKLSRMATVDRNILRLSVYELLYLHEIPTSVALNEAIEIAKKFGTENSGSFINGILDHVAKEVRS